MRAALSIAPRIAPKVAPKIALRLALLSAILLAPLDAALAQDAVEPETLIVEPTIAPGRNIFVAQQSWTGAGAVYIFSADDLSYKGDIPGGVTLQFMLSPDGGKAYVASAFPKRITYGPVEAALATFDTSTLALEGEVIIPPQLAQVLPSEYLLQLTADGQFALAQNARPATSVSVVDLATGTATEIPTPGCYGIYPALEGAAFSSLCGDGTMITVTLDDAGQAATQTKSDAIFESATTPLFMHAERVGEQLAFLTFGGEVVLVSDAGDTIEEVDRFSVTDGVEGDWAPGGYQVLGYSAMHDVLFIPMHSGAYDGSHKDASEEIWAIDVSEQTVLSRSPAAGVTNVEVLDGETPFLFGVNGDEYVLYRFELDPTAGFAATLTDELGEIGDIYMVVAGP